MKFRKRKDRSRWRANFISLAILLFFATALPLRLAAAGPDGRVFPSLLIKGLDGGFVQVADFKGQTVLINFWATWCGPCRMELPAIQRIYERYNGRGLVVLSVNTDTDRTRVKPFLQKLNLSLPVYSVEPEEQARLGVSSIPTTFVVDPSGKIAKTESGYYPQLESDYAALIEKLLEKPKQKS